MFPQPRLELLESHPAAFVETNEKCERLLIVELQPISVDLEKRSHYCHCNALVAINE